MARNAAVSPAPERLTARQRQALDLVDALPNMKPPELRKLWPQYFSVEPFSIKQSILAQCLAYRIQEEAFGGLSRWARSQLDAAAEAIAAGKRVPTAPAKLRIRPGTRILRSWHGELHEVTVTDNGFQYRDKEYASLSEIARTITGVAWSGPLFFGLKKSDRSKGGAE